MSEHLKKLGLSNRTLFTNACNNLNDLNLMNEICVIGREIILSNLFNDSVLPLSSSFHINFSYSSCGRIVFSIIH